MPCRTSPGRWRQPPPSPRSSPGPNRTAVGPARLGLRVAWLEPAGRRPFWPLCARRAGSRGVDCAGVTIDTTRRTGFMLKPRAPRVRTRWSSTTAAARRRVRWRRRISTREPLPRGQPSARHRHHAGALAELRRARRARDAPHARGRPHGLVSTPTCASSPGPAARPWPSTSTASPAGRLGAAWLAEGRLLTGLDAPEDIAAFYPRAAPRQW